MITAAYLAALAVFVCTGCFCTSGGGDDTGGDTGAAGTFSMDNAGEIGRADSEVSTDALLREPNCEKPSPDFESVPSPSSEGCGCRAGERGRIPIAPAGALLVAIAMASLRSDT